jgi:uncharacterized RDD family membrane protein YckC
MMSAGWSNAYGSFARRATARFIDLMVVLLVCASFYLANFELGFPLKYSTLFEYRPAVSFYIFMTYDFPGVSLTFIAVKLFFVFPYFALMESGRWQGTLGKRLMDIKVTGLDGDRISFGRATARYFLKTISAVLFMLGYLISFSNKRQTLHDYLARTLVLKRNVSPAYYAMPTWPSRWMFETPGLSTSEHAATSQSYQCAFCGHRENERLLHCPNCRASIPLGETSVVLGLALMHGIIFSIIGTVVLIIGVRVISFVIDGDTPWPIEALILGLGLLFTAGGVSALFGKNWLARLLIVIFAR